MGWMLHFGMDKSVFWGCGRAFSPGASSWVLTDCAYKILYFDNQNTRITLFLYVSAWHMSKEEGGIHPAKGWVHGQIRQQLSSSP